MAKKSVFISGGGPAGLAAALLFQQMGWDEIVLAERRANPKDFEKNKSFNYLFDGRGQKMIRRLGLMDELAANGVANTSFTMMVVKADGKPNLQEVGIVNPNRPQAYWTTRRNLLSFLAKAAVDKASDGITLLYGHSVEGVSEEATTGRVQVMVTDAERNEKRFTPDLILACDGASSTMREAAAAWPEVPDGHFARTECPSMAGGMQYKVLNFPPDFDSSDGRVSIDDRELAYAFHSKYSDKTRTGPLFAFPIAGEDQPRSLNVIRESDHAIWSKNSAEELLAFLEDSYPQLNIRELIDAEEARDFAIMEPGRFPQPQYIENIIAELGAGEAKTPILLIGDAAHCFPPDLGLGVNSALEDLELLALELETNPDWRAASREFATKRLPENKALVRLVQTTFPEQYATRPWAMRRWVAGFMLRLVLHRIAPSIFDKHVMLLSQDPDIPFSEVENRRDKTNLRIYGLGAALASGLAGAAVWSLT